MRTYLLSSTETKTLEQLITNLVKAAARKELEPVEGVHQVLFNPITRQFAARLTPKPNPEALLRHDPSDIQNLKAAGFVSLCEIPQYKDKPEPQLGRGYGLGHSFSWYYLRPVLDGFVFCHKPEAGSWSKWRQTIQALGDAKATLQALWAGIPPLAQGRGAWV